MCPGGMGYRPNKATVILEDINECDDHENICQNGHCTNTFGSFMCSCNEGFVLDETRTSCIGQLEMWSYFYQFNCWNFFVTYHLITDINECALHPQICGIGQCINDEGKYHCECPEGYMAMPGGSKWYKK